MTSSRLGQSRKGWRILALWFVVAIAAVALLVIWVSGGFLRSMNFSDGTQVTLLQYTHGTVHEFGREDLRKRFKWIPAGVWKAIRYKPDLHVVLRETEPCTVVWLRVKWSSERQEPWPSDLRVQSVEPDGTAYSWDLARVCRSGPIEFILPYRGKALRPAGGDLKVRVVEQQSQRKMLQGHMGPDFEKRNANRRPPEHQMTDLLTLPNPVGVQSSTLDPLPLPQAQEHDGLRATLQSIQAKPLADGEFSIEARCKLLWQGAEPPNAFRCYYSIGTPEGTTAKHNRWGVFDDQMQNYAPPVERMPKAPMRGHRTWLLNLHVLSTASFPELPNEHGIPLFTGPVAARSKGAKAEPPTVSPEATDAGFGIVDTWPPNGLRLVVNRTPEHWFPADWKGGDPLPFVVVAQANEKRVSLRFSSGGGGYGRYGSAIYDFDVTEVPQQLAFGKDWVSRIQSMSAEERAKVPETIEYFLIPRHYWTFTFPVAPVEPPGR